MPFFEKLSTPLHPFIMADTPVQNAEYNTTATVSESQETVEQMEENEPGEVASGVRIFQTTEGNFLIQNPDNTFIKLNNFAMPFSGTEEEFGKQSKRIRAGSSLHTKIHEVLSQMSEKKARLSQVDTIKGFPVYISKEDFKFYIEINWDLQPFSEELAKSLRTATRDMEKIKIDLAPVSMGYTLGDRVMLYWPTGTGKTFEFLQNARAMQSGGQIDDYHIITVTDGFEDIDFLAHIVPTEKGIQYVENSIITILREASEGKKVAILIDELNRGSKSLLNLILKLLDPVDGATYVLNNFVKNETIVIPMWNVMFFATMNLWGKYVGTNVLDEALFDRFNIVQYKGYSAPVEDAMFGAFGTFKAHAKEIVEHIRTDLHKEGEIRAPISTRGVKMWGETFLNSSRSKEDVLASFQRSILHRLISVDDYGNPNEEEVALILNKFRSLWLA